MKENIFYYCSECGNVATLLTNGGGELVCCDQKMTELKANTVDASKEKHVPVVKRGATQLKVDVGSTLHPMTDEHHIEWIAIQTKDNLRISWLHPGDMPSKSYNIQPSVEETEYVNFSEQEEEVPNCEGNPCNFSTTELIEEPVTVYAYCNLHGLWKTIA